MANRKASVSRTIDARVARLASQRHGVFSYDEIMKLGVTRNVVQTRLSMSVWVRVHAGVYRLAGTPITWRQSLRAACLASGAGAAVSHAAAAALRAIAGFEPGRIDISVPRGRRPRPNGVIVHQVALPAVDVTVVDAIPVTTPARTLLDLAAVVGADVIEESLDDALRRGLVSLPRLKWRLKELGRRPGAAIVRRLIDTRTQTTRTPQSMLETRFRRLARHGGLPEPEIQYEIRENGRVVAIPDFAYPAQHLAIEVDGYRWHSGRIRWQLDLRRRNELTRLGWRVIHVTQEDIEQRPAATIRTIAGAIDPADLTHGRGPR